MIKILPRPSVGTKIANSQYVAKQDCACSRVTENNADGNDGVGGDDDMVSGCGTWCLHPPARCSTSPLLHEHLDLVDHLYIMRGTTV